MRVPELNVTATQSMSTVIPEISSTHETLLESAPVIRPKKALTHKDYLNGFASLLDTWGLELDLSRATEVVSQLLDQAAELGTAATLVFHPDKLVRPDWLALYEHALDVR